MVRGFVSIIALAMCFFIASPLAAQERPMAPAEGSALGVDYVLLPMRADLQRRCTCVDRAFAPPRVEGDDAEFTGRGMPLGFGKLSAGRTEGLNRMWGEVLNGQVPLHDTQTAHILLTGRGIGDVQGPDAVVLGARILIDAAANGDKEAQADVGYLFMSGLGVAQSDSWAAYWYGQAALKGSHVAALALGGMYAVGRGVPQDDRAALYWFYRAGRWQYVADAYMCGFGTEPNLDAARWLYERRAEGLDQDAMYQLGNIFTQACGVGLNDEIGGEWYRRAADLGHPDAQIALSEMYYDGRLFDPDSGGSLPLMWAEVAALRLPEGDDARQRALAARERGARLLEPADRALVFDWARAMVYPAPPVPVRK